MKTYRVRRVADRVVCDVLEEGKPVRPLRHVMRHSPDGFECGYGGSGPADLALSLTVDATGREDGYQDVKFALVAPMDRDGGELTQKEIAEVAGGAS